MPVLTPVLKPLISETARDARELWHYTNTAGVSQYDFAAPSCAVMPLHKTAGAYIAALNGVWQAPHGLPVNCMFNDGVLVVAANSSAIIEYISAIACDEQPVACATSLTIKLGQGARLDLLDHAQVGGRSDDPTLQTQMMVVDVADSATFNHVRLNHLPANDYWFTRTEVTVAAGGQYNYTCHTVGAAQSRHQLNVTLAGDAAHAAFAGATQLTGRQASDHTIIVEHAAKHTTSTQNFRAVVDGEARAAFQGKIVVAVGAVKTDARQLHKGIILSPRATVDAKPELEILNDDVACSHGSTCGALDDDALFYLRARGLPEDVARRLLIGAFIAEGLQDAPAFAELLETHDE